MKTKRKSQAIKLSKELNKCLYSHASIAQKLDHFFFTKFGFKNYLDIFCNISNDRKMIEIGSISTWQKKRKGK